MRSDAAVLTAGLLGTAAAAKPDPNTLPLPPMGFNNWARFMTAINESIFVDAAAAMSTNGLLAAGYNRINLDDAWSTSKRNATGSMVWDTTKFPQGMPWLTEHLKSKGFVPGIYSDAGTLSCAADYPGTLGHEDQDLHDFYEWGFEYLKLDGCYVDDYAKVYGGWIDRMAKFNEGKTSGRVVFSNSAPAYFASDDDSLSGWYTTMMQAAAGGQLARHSWDIATYSSDPAWSSVMGNYGFNVRTTRFQQPGFFNDPDFIIADHPGLTLDEKRSQFALWASFSAPLIISADIPNLTDDELAFLTNRDLVAVNQDPLVQQASLVSRDDQWDVLTKSLVNGDRLLTVLNKGNAAADLAVSWARIGVRPDSGATLHVRDLWTGETRSVQASEGGLTASQVPSHGTAVLRISGDKLNVVPTGLILNTQSMKCLTDSASGAATWATCNAADGQTWTVDQSGRVSSLLNSGSCLGSKDGVVATSKGSCRSTWWFPVSGNVIHKKSGLCLQENKDASISAAKCGTVTDEQVFGVPVGVGIDYS
ncbi:Aldolase-type TIM barrel [Cordyceps fumosorosea ARSEF 2679]|uniref:Alpha-galactosidase n=1 Tax=Cordyceps fumosorosea (strain ARSEF 2679) TaxID=1081104 RepID=A0A167LV97_CORFA|nr:Aldolase-type TIM barrel [Cordyceps fumosorosea ARSEF 2679]OAA53553.1 Aldolase-type TIM barrel [Cordyceps fumosorosea ARSEF 2679]